MVTLLQFSWCGCRVPPTAPPVPQPPHTRTLRLLAKSQTPPARAFVQLHRGALRALRQVGELATEALAGQAGQHLLAWRAGCAGLAGVLVTAQVRALGAEWSWWSKARLGLLELIVGKSLVLVPVF